jgi:hypothetical protein
MSIILAHNSCPWLPSISENHRGRDRPPRQHIHTVADPLTTVNITETTLMTAITPGLRPPLPLPSLFPFEGLLDILGEGVEVALEVLIVFGRWDVENAT